MRLLGARVALPMAVVLGLALGGPTADADPPVPPGTKAAPAGQEHRAEQAEATLDRVQDLVSGRGQRGAHGDQRDLTLALRDLRLQAGDLSSADKRVAERYFLRPGGGSDPYVPASLPNSKCFADICVHWTDSGADAAIPRYVDQVLAKVQQLNDDYVAAGYRTPVRDGSIGGDTDKVDIYLGDIGADDLYGFCNTDDPKASDPSATTGDVWAYCVLDNDYAPEQFPINTPTENMRVTAAHEYFHAVQYAYDFAEDGWLMESTATWVEDEMYDAVNDNRYYLRDGPLGRPHISLDTFGARGFHYGTWLWWRHLTEKFPVRTGELPNLVLDVWTRLDDSLGGPDQYSTQGLAGVLSDRGTSLRAQLQRFYAANRHPGTGYEEGGAYPASPTRFVLAYGGAVTKGASFRAAHMSSAAARLKPNGLSQADWKLELTFDAPSPSSGGAFVVMVYKKSGAISSSLVPLDPTGAGATTVPFSTRGVTRVDVLFVNTSDRFTCGADDLSPYTCRGVPMDDGLPSQFVGRAFRA